MSLDDALARLRAASKEQLSAAWQIHVSRVEEQLRAGWREQIEDVIDQRLAEVPALVAHESAQAATAMTEKLNQTARRLRQAENVEEWKAAVEDAAAGFCSGAAIYDAGLDEIAQAPAMATVIETKDTVVTLRSASELPGAVMARFGEAGETRCYLFPVMDGARVAAILYAQPDERGLDSNGLELLTALAGATIPKPAAPAFVMPVPAAVATTPQPVAISRASILLDWSSLSAEEQETHLRAQRFARVRVAEMRLYDADAVKRGRLDRNLYRCLQGKIDAARGDFRKEFVEKCPSMTDYLHRELVRTLANDDEGAMGQEYPGALA